MAVVNVTANQGVSLGAGTVQGLMHVYCMGPGPATVGITIAAPPPPFVNHHITPGNMVTFQVDRYAVWVYNNGPSTIQLLYNQAFQGKAIHEVEGAVPIDQTS
jgi:hypothetical protein